MKMQFHKAVVKVLVIVAPDRTKTPVSLTFEDGKEYPIDRVCGRGRNTNICAEKTVFTEMRGISRRSGEPQQQKLAEQVSVIRS